MNLMLLEQENQDLKRRVMRLEKVVKGMQQATTAPSDCKVGRLGKVLKLVCEEYGLSLADMTNRRREAWRAYPRQVAMYLCREHARCGNARPTFQHIGQAVGKLDHGTVMYAVKRVKNAMETEPTERARILKLAEQIKA